MDFEHVLTTLLNEFDRRQIHYAVVGGFAMGALGAPRMTMDLDILVDRDDLEPLGQVMSKVGYLRFAQTANVTQYRHPDARWGAVDVIHAFRQLAREMVSRAKPHPIFGGTRTIRVAEPEDVIGLKVQAIANNPERRLQEQADIERLLVAHKDHVDWGRIQDYYDLFEMGEEARRLKERFGHAQ